IYVVNADGSAVSRLTNNSAYDLQPVWSPDGTKIAFDSDRDGNTVANTGIYVMNADGSGVRRLTDPGGDYGPAWSPDGSPIAAAPPSASRLTSGVQDFTATVTNDPSNSGVTWSITGCSGGAAACGSLTNVTNTSATYTAPATVPPAGPGVTATSVTDNSKSLT